MPLTEEEMRAIAFGGGASEQLLQDAPQQPDHPQGNLSAEETNAIATTGARPGGPAADVPLGTFGPEQEAARGMFEETPVAMVRGFITGVNELYNLIAQQVGFAKQPLADTKKEMDKYFPAPTSEPGKIVEEISAGMPYGTRGGIVRQTLRGGIMGAAQAGSFRSAETAEGAGSALGVSALLRGAGALTAKVANTIKLNNIIADVDKFRSSLGINPAKSVTHAQEAQIAGVAQDLPALRAKMATPEGMVRYREQYVAAKKAAALRDQLLSLGEDDLAGIVHTQAGATLFAPTQRLAALAAARDKAAQKYGQNLDVTQLARFIENGRSGSWRSAMIDDKSEMSKLLDNLEDSFYPRGKDGKIAYAALPQTTFTKLLAAREQIDRTFDKIRKGGDLQELADMSSLREGFNDFFNGAARRASVARKGGALASAQSAVDRYHRNVMKPLQEQYYFMKATPQETYAYFLKEAEKNPERIMPAFKAMPRGAQDAVRSGFITDALINSVQPETKTVDPRIFLQRLKDPDVKRFFDDPLSQSKLKGMSNLLSYGAQTQVGSQRQGSHFMSRFLWLLALEKMARFNVEGMRTGFRLGVAATVGSSAMNAAHRAWNDFQLSRKGTAILLSSAKVAPNSPQMQELYDRATNLLTSGASRHLVESGEAAEGVGELRSFSGL